MTRGRTIHGGNSGATDAVVGSVVGAGDSDDPSEGKDNGSRVGDGSSQEGSGAEVSLVVVGAVVNWVEKPVAFCEQIYLKSRLDAS